MGPRRLVQGNWIGQEQLRQARFSGLVSFPPFLRFGSGFSPFFCFFLLPPPFFSSFSLSKRSRLTCLIAWVKPGAASNPAFRETLGRSDAASVRGTGDAEG